MKIMPYPFYTYFQGLTFEVEGHWLVSRQVPCKTEGRSREPLGGSGVMLPRKIFRTEVS